MSFAAWPAFVNRAGLQQTAHARLHQCAAAPVDNSSVLYRIPEEDVSSPLHPLVRTMADDFHGPRAEDLDQLHRLQKSTKRPAKGDSKPSLPCDLRIAVRLVHFAAFLMQSLRRALAAAPV